MLGHNNKDDRKIEEDFVLKEQPGSFRSPSKKKSVFIAQAFYCCCCCWHIVGAYLGAYIGGAVGSGIAYKRVQRENEKVVKYRWLFLWSFLSTASIIGVLYIFTWLEFDVPSDLQVPLLVLLAVWFVLINPCLCFIAAKKFSWRVLLVSLLFSAPTAAIGFGIGWAIMV